jgi:hypothetical protein
MMMMIVIIIISVPEAIICACIYMCIYSIYIYALTNASL